VKEKAMNGLTGRVAIITGGTGALGRAVSEAFLHVGATVIAPYIVEAEVPLLRNRVGAYMSHLECPKADVTQEQEVRTLVRSVAERHGRIDILVNLVGGFWGGKSVSETDERDWDFMLQLNLKSAFLCAKVVAPEMLKGGWGRIVSVSSRAGVMGFGDYAAYSVAKGAIITLTKALAEELLPHNITVNAIAPSTIDTEANRQAMSNADWSRWVKPEEVAKVLTFLCSDDAQIISGALIPVYGRA
jgi:NAD(P)-dependent dehydrogenase (short-subunit alcohol dehydrogenase family)